MSDAYVGNFFLCDFRGTPAFSGVRTFKMEPAGASFRLIDPEVIVWGCLATDVDFGPRGWSLCPGLGRRLDGQRQGTHLSRL